MHAVGAVLWPKFCAFQIYGANTNVGKTIVAATLCGAARALGARVHYLKPVSTGPDNESDNG
jgi:dethiobiotin synthetase/adenosylmethionine--8-amino-7-oxononanoate aminotransferase